MSESCNLHNDLDAFFEPNSCCECHDQTKHDSRQKFNRWIQHFPYEKLTEKCDRCRKSLPRVKQDDATR